MRSIISMRVLIKHDGIEKVGMVSSIKGETIHITINSNESIDAPLDLVEISYLNPEEQKDGIELEIKW